MIDNTNNIVIVSAPSATGKTSLDMRLQQQYQQQLTIVRSCTTREARSQDTQDKDYIFLSKTEFQQMIDRQEFVEWAAVFGNFYGTSRQEIERIISAGKTALLEIDVQGGKQIKKRFPEARLLFILPPTIAELRRRLVTRATDSLTAQRQRLLAAYHEIRRGLDYQYFIVNDDLELAYQDLENIIIHSTTGRLTREQGVDYCQQLMIEFKQLEKDVL